MNLSMVANTIAHRVACEEYAEQQRDLQHHRDTRSDPDSRAREQQLNNVQRQQVHT